MWVRLHTAPKQCGKLSLDTMTCRQAYYFNASFKRYSETEDGKYINNVAPSLTGGEIGRAESVRFIVAL